MRTITLPDYHPTFASLKEALADVAAVYLNGEFIPNSGESWVACEGPDLDEIALHLVTNEAEDIDITMGELLDSVIVDGFQALRLPTGELVQIIPCKPFSFAPDLARGAAGETPAPERVSPQEPTADDLLREFLGIFDKEAFADRYQFEALAFKVRKQLSERLIPN